jgi:hypothetical protein
VLILLLLLCNAGNRLAGFIQTAAKLLHRLTAVSLLHTPQAHAILRLLSSIVRSWPDLTDGDHPTSLSQLLPLLQQLQTSICDIYRSKPASGSSSSSSVTVQVPLETVALLIDLQYAFVWLAEFAVEYLVDVNEGTMSAAEVADLVALFDEEGLHEACMQLLAAACCCWGSLLHWQQAQLEWQQQQQRQPQHQQEQQQQQQEQQQPQRLPLQRTRLHRGVLPLSLSNVGLVGIPYYWGPDGQLLRFPVGMEVGYESAALLAWKVDKYSILLNCKALPEVDAVASSAVRVIMLWKGLGGPAVEALPAEIHLSTHALLLLYWRLQQLEQRQQQQQLSSAVLSAGGEGTLLTTSKQLQELLEANTQLHLAAAGSWTDMFSLGLDRGRVAGQVLLATAIEAQHVAGFAAAAAAAAASQPHSVAAAAEGPEVQQLRQRLLDLLTRLSKVAPFGGVLQVHTNFLLHGRLHNLWNSLYRFFVTDTACCSAGAVE